MSITSLQRMPGLSCSTPVHAPGNFTSPQSLPSFTLHQSNTDLLRGNYVVGPSSNTESVEFKLPSSITEPLNNNFMQRSTKYEDTRPKLRHSNTEPLNKNFTSLRERTDPDVASTQSMPVWRSLSSRGVGLQSRSNTMSSMSAKTKARWGDESYSEFVLLFNRATLSPFITYLIIDKNTGRTANIFPKINSMFMSRLKNVVEYRIVTVDNMVSRFIHRCVCLCVCVIFLSFYVKFAISLQKR